MAAAVGIERPHLQALLCQHVEVDIGDRRLVRHGKPFGLGQSVAVLEHRCLAVPGEVSRGFPCPGGGIQIGGQTAGGLGTAQQAAGLGLADGDVAGRQVRQHGRPGDGRLSTGRIGHPDVLADFCMDDQAAYVGCFPQQVGAERDRAAADGDATAIGAVATDEVPGFIELPIVGQMDFRHDTENLPAMNGQGAVVQSAEMPQRRAHQQQRHQFGRTGDDRLDRGFHGVQQHRLLQQIADRVTGNAEFREYCDRHRLPVAIPGHAQNRLRVGRRIGQRGGCGARGDTSEAVAIKGTETHDRPGL